MFLGVAESLCMQYSDKADSCAKFQVLPLPLQVLVMIINDCKSTHDFSSKHIIIMTIPW